MTSQHRAAALIVAAGSGQRMGGRNKAFLEVSGRTLLHWCLAVLDPHPAIQRLVVVTTADDYGRTRTLLEEAGLETPWLVVLGGARRQDSVESGLRQVTEEMDLVLVHDAARPFLDRRMVDDALDAAARDGAAITAVPCRDTAKTVGPDGLVRETVERSLLWLVQTPQVFQRPRLEWAFTQVRDDVTDEAAMLERCGQPVRVVQGSHWNLKLTWPEDLAIADAIAQAIAARDAGDGAGP